MHKRARSSARKHEEVGTQEVIPRRMRKKRRRELFRLEDLPTELLEVIFLYSGNFNLPLISSVLVAQLAGARLQNVLTTEILTPVLLDLRVQPSRDQLSRFEDLLCRRFCTWSFFRKWLQDHMASCRTVVAAKSQFDSSVTHDPTDVPVIDWREVRSRSARAHKSSTQSDITTAMAQEDWVDLMEKLLRGPRITTAFHLPSKLLHGPWTEDRVDFLKCCRPLVREKLFIDTADGAKVSSYDGITDAICEGRADVIRILSSIGAEPGPNAVRLAVLNAGCDPDVVDMLLHCYMQASARRLAEGVSLELFDALDPALWAWAEAPEQMVNGKGMFLKDRLQMYLDISISRPSPTASVITRTHAKLAPR